METSLGHVRANVKNLQKAIGWYETHLGFKVEALWPPEKPNYAHFEKGNGAIFAIMEHPDYPSPGRFNFYIDDVNELWKELKARVTVVEELFDTEYGSTKFTIADLDGNELGFIQA
ncbi:VOC family protein [Halobacillus salinarum]|uniref:VOC family protein n=1 Tax=Halobacillus salinarum TaxID=2932257 RepID=A0ABY4ELM2_9BACI|nr:VOC family protein [Halobacillus salinarum]UOQ45300.1 VOC family protein [Halobacillus salinarum]